MGRRVGLLEGFTWVVAGLVVVNLYMGLLYARDPVNLQTEVTRKAQHIFYYHMGMNVMAGLGLTTNFLAGILYLATRRRLWDVIARAAAEIGVVFGVAVLVTGSLWARPAWNTWWTWDPRLTTATITVLLYIAYLMLRNAVEDPNRRARFAAVYGTFAYISVPITFMSIRWWRTIHPTIFGAPNPEAQGGFVLGSTIRTALLFSLATHMVLFALFLLIRARIGLVEERVARLRDAVMVNISRGAEVEPVGGER